MNNIPPYIPHGNPVTPEDYNALLEYAHRLEKRTTALALGNVVLALLLGVLTFAWMSTTNLPPN